MMNHWIFRCSDVSQWVSRSMEGPLPVYRRLGVRMHLMVCSYCSLFRRQLFALRRMSRDVNPAPTQGQDPTKLSDDAKARIKNNIRSEL